MVLMEEQLKSEVSEKRTLDLMVAPNVADIKTARHDRFRGRRVGQIGHPSSIAIVVAILDKITIGFAARFESREFVSVVRPALAFVQQARGNFRQSCNINLAASGSVGPIVGARRKDRRVSANTVLFVHED